MPARILGLLLVGAMLSACAMIPSAGPVLAGNAVNSDSQEGLLQVIAVGPAAGDSAQAVVTGFLHAAADFTDDHQVARSFLTPQRRLAWRPDAAVVIYPSESSLKLREPAGTASSGLGSVVPGAANASGVPGAPNVPQTDRVTVQTPVQARIDIDGRYQLAPAGDRMTATFTLLKVAGQWRISDLADGILMPALEFAVTFRPFPVYFTDPAGHYLVPEEHWFATTTDLAELPTDLVRALLEGPPTWMKGAVTTWVPPGTGMAVAAVVVSGDVATVDLTYQVRRATTRQRQLLLSQLQATLSRLSTIAVVQITVGRVTLDVPSGSGSGSSDSRDPSDDDVQPITDPGVDPRPVVIDSKGRLARLDGRTLELVKGVTGLSSVPGANRPAVASDSSAYAVLNAGRDKLLLQLPGTKMVTLVKAPGLTAPSFDPAGWLWTVSGDSDVVYAAGIDSQTVKLRSPWLKHLHVVALRISRDGTRVVIAVQYHGRGRLLLGGVVRDGRNRPVALTDPISLVPDLKTIKDVAWIDEDDVVALAERSTDGEVRPLVVQLGGTVQAGTPVPGAESVAAGNDELSLMVSTAHGIQARSGALWEKVTSARWPAFAG